MLFKLTCGCIALWAVLGLWAFGLADVRLLVLVALGFLALFLWALDKALKR